MKETKISWKGHKGRKFGAKMNKKNDENLRIIFGNINTLPKHSNRFKLDLWKEIVTTGCDINIVAEINKDTRKISRIDRTDQLVKGWWILKIVCRDEFLVKKDCCPKEDTTQPGGVSIITNGVASQHIIGQGGDSRKLGRWRWVIIRGE